MLKDDSHKVYRDGNDLLNVFEIDCLVLLENCPVLVGDIDEARFNFGIAVAVGQFAKENELVVADRVFWGVDGLHNIYNAGHSGYAVENDPVAGNGGKQNRGNVFHL